MAHSTTRLVPAGGVVTPRMRRLLLATLVLFALLSVDSIYLSSITLMEWITGEPRQNAFYLWMFLGHLVLGLAITLPAIAFGAWHWKRSHHHPNRRAVRMGNVTFVAAIVTLLTGLVLTRVDVAGVVAELRRTRFDKEVSQEEIRVKRGTLTEPGQNSPFRDRSVEENLDLFTRMRAGEFPN
ncbi:MAG: hypothetical protein EBU31_15825, partial [Proteobacteria bacterium]|nr:hypothetical protein [Pseudomonadota bacterium]